MQFHDKDLQLKCEFKQRHVSGHSQGSRRSTAQHDCSETWVLRSTLTTDRFDPVCSSRALQMCGSCCLKDKSLHDSTAREWMQDFATSTCGHVMSELCLATVLHGCHTAFSTTPSSSSTRSSDSTSSSSYSSHIISCCQDGTTMFQEIDETLLSRACSS